MNQKNEGHCSKFMLAKATSIYLVGTDISSFLENSSYENLMCHCTPYKHTNSLLTQSSYGLNGKNCFPHPPVVYICTVKITELTSISDIKAFYTCFLPEKTFLYC